MCNLYKLKRTTAEVADLFRARAAGALNHAEDVYPGYTGLVAAGGAVRAMTWGFPLSLTGAKGQKLKPRPVNNARFDKLGSPFWRRWAADPTQRCLIPLSAFAEAVGERGRMTRTWLSVAGQPVFAWAGLWRPTDEWGECYTGVMTDNAPELAEIHDRSPVILDPGEWDTWLTAPLADLARFDRPFPAARIVVEATGELWRGS